MISIVVACGSNLVIGRDGGLPWHLPTDMRRFRDLTAGAPVIMGRKTFESLPGAYRPLPNRRNLVLSTDPDYAAPDVEVLADLRSAIDRCDGDCFVIGGAQVYSQALPRADRVYLTQVETACEGDAFFPALQDHDWVCWAESERIAENGHEFVFRAYDRAA